MDVTYRARPYVCGAVGRFDEAHIDRLKAGAPAPLRELHRSTTAVLLASADVQAWQAGDDRGFSWNALAEGVSPSSWQAAAERWGAAGLAFSATSSTLHTDAVGIQDLFTRRIGDAVYFSVRIDLLARLDDSALHTDWTAWASILALAAPMSDATPFEEIRRMTAATAWQADDRGVSQTSFEPGWLAAEPDGSVKPHDAVAAVDACVPGGDRLAITLSGGWDSRLLAILARRRSDEVVAWTTSDDDGRDRDLRLAPPVAEALGIEHHNVVPGDDAWLEELSPVRRRFDFQSLLHVWLMPLARVLHGRPERLLDGLAGDVLFKSLFVPEEVAAAVDPDERHRLLWDNLGQNRLNDPARLAPGVSADFEARSRASVVDSVARFDGHPAAATLGVLHTRTARAIALSPLRLLAPESDVRVPFVHPVVIDAALRVAPTDKLDGRFYRDMLVSADPKIARLPSTNDGGPKEKRGPRRQTSPAALGDMAAMIRADGMVAGLLGPEIRQSLDDADTLHRVGTSVRGHRVLNWASLLAEWRATYASVLADDTPA